MSQPLKQIRKHWQLYLVILPSMVYILVFKYYPMVGVQIAFKDFNIIKGIWGSEWVGLEHFIGFIHNPNFWLLIKNTLGISLYGLAIGFPAPILLALALNEIRNGIFKKSVQMVTYAPFFISTVIMVSIIIVNLSPNVGVVSKLYTILGWEPVDFMGIPSFFKSIYVWSDVWQHTGYGAIIYLAALSGVNPELYEAAKVDGASRVQKIMNVDIPSIIPVTVVMLVLNVGNIMKLGFEKIYLMQNPLNLSTSEVISTYVYKVGLIGADFSFSAAVGLFNSVINLVLLLIVNYFAYSPYDGSANFYEQDAKAYDDYFVNQITELLTNYGEIDILWFDGCGSEDHEYDWPRIIGEIRRLQPNILIFNMGDPDFRWVGNEDGIAPETCWNEVDAVEFSILTEETDRLAERLWLPAECDVQMRSNWFYSDGDLHTLKSLEELMGLYYLSVGHGANLLLNIGPDREGRLPAEDTDRLLAFGAEIRRRFEEPIASLSLFHRSEGRWEYETKEPKLIDHIVIGEDLTDGENVRGFALSIVTAKTRRPVRIYEGRCIGHKRIIRIPAVKVRGVTLEILESDGEPRICELSLCYAGESGSRTVTNEKEE